MKPLLSIAIPTWNRAGFLENALERLLPEVSKFSESIEVIISDNASTDNTQEVISRYKKMFPEINLSGFLQEKNTGQYGNFRKCRELSEGKYFWLLSDNDYVLEGTISKVIEILKKYENTGLVFLRDWVVEKPAEIHHDHSGIISFDQLVREVNYKPTLISACIILNCRDEDPYLFERYHANSFIGFILLLKAIKCSDKAVVLEGPSLWVDEDAEVKFDVIKSWVEDISECVAYMTENALVSGTTRNYLNNIILKENIKSYYLLYKSKGRAFGAGNISIGELNRRIFRHYRKYRYFWKSIFPFMFFPSRLLNYYVFNPEFKKLKKNVRSFITTR